MENFIEQTPSELLTSLLDGELEEAHETELFASLSQSGELRSELRDMLAIREAVRNDTEAFVPPVEATRSVFAELGIQPHNNPVPVVDDRQIPGGLLLFGKRILVPAAAALLGSIFTALFIMNIYQSKIDQLENRIATVNSFENPKSQGGTAEPGINNLQNQENMLPEHKNIQKHTIARSTQNTLTNQVNNENGTAESNVQAVPPISNGIKPAISYIPGNPATLYSYSPSLFNSESAGLLTPAVAEKNRPMAEASTLVGTSTQALSNWGLCYYVLNSGNLHIGFEIGQEPFTQKYLEKKSNQSIPYETSQNPTVFFGGISAKLNMPQWSITNGLYPFGQAFAGSSGLGPILKGIIGVQYDITNSIGFNLGTEGSLLYYSNQGVSYTTRKLGVRGGATLKF